MPIHMWARNVALTFGSGDVGMVLAPLRSRTSVFFNLGEGLPIGVVDKNETMGPCSDERVFFEFKNEESLDCMIDFFVQAKAKLFPKNRVHAIVDESLLKVLAEATQLPGGLRCFDKDRQTSIADWQQEYVGEPTVDPAPPRDEEE